jgi:hypothetical protein
MHEKNCELCPAYFLTLTPKHACLPIYIYIYRERIIHGCAEIPDLFRVLNMISHEWAQRTSEIPCSTREINLVFPSTHVFFCSLYKQNSVKNNKTSVEMRFTTNDIFTRKNIVFLRVFKYDFSQWPKTLYNTYVYIINIFII